MVVVSGVNQLSSRLTTSEEQKVDKNGKNVSHQPLIQWLNKAEQQLFSEEPLVYVGD